jgi:hypothetical protein
VLYYFSTMCDLRFKLGMIEVACSHFFFTAPQALEVGPASVINAADHSTQFMYVL